MAFKYKQHENGIASQKIGEKIAIYDKYAAASGINNGDVTIYERGDDGDWIELTTIAKAANFGSSLDLYRGVAAAGDTTTEIVYISSSSDNFSSDINLIPTSSADGFGSSVSISDNYIAVGAPERDSNRGGVYIYVKNGDNWTSMTEYSLVVPDDAAISHLFGTSVAINENFLIVGAKGDNSSRGAVYVFARNVDTGVWNQSQKIIASDGAAGDEFGGQVSLSGDYFAVGVEFADLSDTEVNVGAVYIFNYSVSWNELKKITGVGESGLIANNFGHSLDLQGDYLMVGSPSAQNRGVADIFYKKRNWGHLKKIDDTLTSISDSFGGSVGIYYPYSVIGAFGFTDGSDEGRVYFYEDPPVRLRLSQEFEADFAPSKASVYLKRSGSNDSESWTLSSSSATIIDSSNFSTITQSVNNSVFDDRVTGFTGNGYMAMSPDDSVVGNSFSIINYPIRNSVPTSYNVWIRCHSGGSDPSSSFIFNVDMLLDGIVVKNINSIISDDSWTWLNTTLILPDTRQHILGIRLKEKDSIIDKIYIDADDNFTPEGDGPPYLASPYVTVHMKVYESDGLSPADSLQVYSYKTTLDEIIQDDWYNFNITFIDTLVSEYGALFFLVMSSSGASADNFVIWEILDSDEYFSTSAGLRTTEIASNSNSVRASLTKRFYYEAKAGDADIDTDTWYLDNTKTHAFRIYSDFDPIEDV